MLSPLPANPDPHPAFPEWIEAVLEQCPGDTERLRYEPADGSFVPTGDGYLPGLRGYTGAYGWVEGLGRPPGPHLDVLVLSLSPSLRHGERVEAQVCGMLRRADGDHKLVAATGDVMAACRRPDWASLPAEWREQLQAVYPVLSAGEAWLDGRQAREFLRRSLHERQP